MAAIEEVNDFCIRLLLGAWMSLLNSFVIRHNAVLEIFIYSQVILPEQRK